MSEKKNCPTCRQLIPLPNHLYELAEYSNYLDNSVSYRKGDSVKSASSTVIGYWLKLAAQLEKVEINSWKFAGYDDSAFYCRPSADIYDSDTEHYTIYSTFLTKFIFITNALEESYRFIEQHYDNHPEILELPRKEKVTNASMKAAALLDKLANPMLPLHFSHITDNLKIAFHKYDSEFSLKTSGMTNVNNTDLSFGLHLIRNIRNHIAHGGFPISENPEYWGEQNGELLIRILFNASRVSALYIQLMLFQYNQGFKSYEYEQIVGAHGAEFERFLDKCTIDYVNRLHVQGDFSFEEGLYAKY